MTDEKAKKADFALHVALLSENKAAATFRAWCEGPAGLQAILNPEAATPNEA